jgi:hypothetical protein
MCAGGRFYSIYITAPPRCECVCVCVCLCSGCDEYYVVWIPPHNIIRLFRIKIIQIIQLFKAEYANIPNLRTTNCYPTIHIRKEDRKIEKYLRSL